MAAAAITEKVLDILSEPVTVTGDRRSHRATKPQQR